MLSGVRPASVVGNVPCDPAQLHLGLQRHLGWRPSADGLGTDDLLPGERVHTALRQPQQLAQRIVIGLTEQGRWPADFRRAFGRTSSRGRCSPCFPAPSGRGEQRSRKSHGGENAGPSAPGPLSAPGQRAHRPPGADPSRRMRCARASNRQRCRRVRLDAAAAVELRDEPGRSIASSGCPMAAQNAFQSSSSRTAMVTHWSSPRQG